MTKQNSNPPALPTNTATVDLANMSKEEMLAHIAALTAENKALEQKGGRGHGPGLTVKTSAFIGELDKAGQPGKGTVGCYGLGTRPITAYSDQWRRVFLGGVQMADHILSNLDRLGFKTPEQKQQTKAFFEAARPHLVEIANLTGE